MAEKTYVSATDGSTDGFCKKPRFRCRFWIP